LEGQIRNSTILFQEITDHISNLYKTSDSVRLECQKEKEELASLQQKRMKQEALVRQFENDNEAHNKIRKAAEEKVNYTLASRKELLRLAVFSYWKYTIQLNPSRDTNLFILNMHMDLINFHKALLTYYKFD
jgi:hypothetical protein